MASTLIECSGCRRHVRDDEPSCPFCAAPVDLATRARAASKRRPVIRNVPRAVALGLTVGMAALSGSAGCDDDVEDGNSTDSDTAQQPPYGAPAVGSGGTSSASTTGGNGGRGADGGSEGGAAGDGGAGGDGGHGG